jgi:hypothetical protein
MCIFLFFFLSLEKNEFPLGFCTLVDFISINIYGFLLIVLKDSNAIFEFCKKKNYV